MDEKRCLFLKWDLNISTLCGGEEVDLQIYVLVSLKWAHSPKASQIGCKYNRWSANTEQRPSTSRRAHRCL